MKTIGDPGLLRELEPCVARYVDRHLRTSRMWFPHQYVPWSTGSDFDGPLGGEPWDPGQAALPAAVRDAMVVNLLTEDNLPSYHLEIVRHVGRDGPWGTWVHRWTAEEDRHSHALRAYLTATRSVDPIALEEERMRHVSTGFRFDHDDSLLSALSYVAVQELATRVAHRNTGRACREPAGAGLLARIAADENLHMVFYRDVCSQALELAPEAFIRAFTDVLTSFRMPGHTLRGYGARAGRIAAFGIFDPRIHHDQVVVPLVRSLGLLERGALHPEGARAQDDLGRHLEDSADRADRFDRLRPRLARRHPGGTERPAAAPEQAFPTIPRVRRPAPGDTAHRAARPGPAAADDGCPSLPPPVHPLDRDNGPRPHPPESENDARRT
ncbi:acyl-ACP desaturase [Streptomyces sp. NPDC050560]|uniref:acyl-ACP desaturase n=1 Tax=Streptomyces sp. NPDC050560 TaxID=3365630 RepID=UPI0037B7C8B2